MSQQAGAQPRHVAVMALTAGVTVANIYYNQPILAEIAGSFGASPGQVGSLPVLTQAGYGLGLLVLTPLGDMVDRRTLVVVLQALLAAALAGMVAVGGLPGLYAASFLVGLLAVSVQVILPMAAALAGSEEKGRVVGIVFTGTLTGILSARIVSGFVAEWFGWRWVYALSAALVLASTLLLVRVVPALPSHHRGGYVALLRSTLHQVRRFPQLRRAALLGALVFGTFCSFWTTLTFHLSGPPFEYRSDVIGLFGLLAIGGALAASVVGRLADGRDAARLQLLTVGLVAVSVLCVQVWPASAAAFVVATLLLDVGVQATQAGNLAQIYALDETAHSRINTVYMTTTFIGGAVGTAAGVAAWTHGGWAAVCWQLLAWCALALAVAATDLRDAAPPAVPEDPQHAPAKALEAVRQDERAPLP